MLRVPPRQEKALLFASPRWYQILTSEVQENIANAPPHSALPPIVHIGLRHVLDQGNAKLDVGADVDEVEPCQHRQRGQDDAD